MSKVTPLFTRQGVQKILCEAADMGLREVILLGLKPNGCYHIAMSDTDDMVKFVGMVRLLEHDCLMALYENYEDV